MSSQHLLTLTGITKAYPGVIANDDVSFSIENNSIHALLGENGAGKSTLVKMIYGLVQPDKGSLTLEGKDFHPKRPQDAREAGVGMVFQHFSLFEALNVWENIALGLDHPPSPKQLRRDIEEVSANYGLPIDPNRRVGNLSAGERQRVEIVRALLQNPKLLIMDEPTSVLTPGEVETLFKTLRVLRDEGTSILYISHKLEEIRALCDDATVLRRGKVVANCDPRTQTALALAELMVGDSIPEAMERKGQIGDVLLDVVDANLPSEDSFGTSLKKVNFSVRKGEILGVAGVAGNGQDEFLALISGERLPTKGRIRFGDQNISAIGVKARRLMGLLSAPEERLGHAAVPAMSLKENAMLTASRRKALASGGWMNWRKTHDFAEEIVSSFDVRTPSVEVEAKSLSGGNLQKYVVGREILQNPKVLVINQPTWGVDAAAAAFIRQAIRDLADEGAAIIVISQDLDELFELADRMVVLAEGRLSPSYLASEIHINNIGQLMAGMF